MTKAIPFEDKAAGWIDRLKGPDISPSLRVGCLERLLISLAAMVDRIVADSLSSVPEEWHDDSFTD